MSLHLLYNLVAYFQLRALVLLLSLASAEGRLIDNGATIERPRKCCKPWMRTSQARLAETVSMAGINQSTGRGSETMERFEWHSEGMLRKSEI